MANRNFANGGKIYTMTVSPVIMTATITIGAAGAVASFTGSMVASVVRISTGIYQINSTDNFNSVVTSRGSMRSPVSGLSGVVAIEIQNAPSASMSPLVAPSLTIKCLSPSGALVDPASGSTIDMMTILNNSSIKS